MNNRGELLKNEGRVWITPTEGGQDWSWLTMLLADEQVRRLLIALGAKLPVIKF